MIAPTQPDRRPTTRVRFDGGPRDGRVMTIDTVRREGTPFGYDAPDEIEYGVITPDGGGHLGHTERIGVYRRYATIQPTGSKQEQHLYRWDGPDAEARP